MTSKPEKEVKTLVGRQDAETRYFCAKKRGKKGPATSPMRIETNCTLSLSETMRWCRQMITPRKKQTSSSNELQFLTRKDDNWSAWSGAAEMHSKENFQSPKKVFLRAKLKKHQQIINKTPFDTLALCSWGLEGIGSAMGTALVSLPFMTLTLINEFRFWTLLRFYYF
jgi:hypothetical protein